jgi:hypothetical protein
MPLARISLRRGKSPVHIAALRNGIYQAMRESFNVPENDRFIWSASTTPASSTTTRTTSASPAATIW